MAGPRVGVIVNEGKELAGDGLEELRAALADAGHPDPPWRQAPKSKEAPPLIRELVEEEGVDRLLVWGGDGTVRRTIDTLRAAGHDHVELGVLPAGTANLLAAELGIPADLRAAVDIAIGGAPRPIDLGVLDGEHHFAVMLGAGFDALVADEADGTLKDRFGWFGYAWAGVRHRHVSAARATVTVDGEPWYEGPATTVIVANVERLIGSMPAFPHADPTDGRLEVGVAHVDGTVDWLRLLGSVWTRRARRSPFVEITTGEAIEIELDRTVRWQVDGGDRERRSRFDVRCLPAAIRICGPPDLPPDH